MTKQDINNFIGIKIKKFRKENGVSQEVLADFLGITRESVANIESGKHSATMYNIYKISCAFGVNPNSFFPDLVPIKKENRIVKSDKTKSFFVN